MSDDQVVLSESLQELIRLAFEHAFDELDESEGEGLIPFVVVDQKGERFMQRFLDEESEDESGELVIETSRAAIKDITPAPERVVLVFDGVVEIDDDGERDAVIVEAFEAGEKAAYRMFLTYQPATEDEELEVDDTDIEILEEMDPMF